MNSKYFYKVFLLLYLVSSAPSLWSQWVNIDTLNHDILIDMRYAGPHNFVGKTMYPCAKCLVRPEVAIAMSEAQKILIKNGHWLKVYDCFRPGDVQQLLWDQFPNPSYVTPPWKGSNHNRGMAVDIGLTDSCGTELDMGSGFDHLGKASHHDYTDLPDSILFRRRLLKETMESVGFKGIRTEWWHYNYFKKKYPLSRSVWECD